MTGTLQSLIGESATRTHLAGIDLAYSKAVSIANTTGSLSYSSDSYAGTDARGTALKDVQMSFLLDLAGGAISSGKLVVDDASHVQWTVTFNGKATGSTATMTNLGGKLTGDGKFASGAITGVFVGTNPKPDFLSAFKLQSATDTVSGLVALKP